MNYKATFSDNSELYFLEHYGIKDMKWGVRRFQDYAGKLTAAGRDRYGVGLERAKQAASRAKTDMRMLGADVRDYSKSYKKARFAATLAKEKGRAYGSRAREKMRPVSKLAKTSYRELAKRLNTQSAEATRLRSYVASSRYQQAKRVAMSNLANQARYRDRISAAKSFIEESSRVGRLSGLLSDARFSIRTGTPVVRKGAGMLGTDSYERISKGALNYWLDDYASAKRGADAYRKGARSGGYWR